MLSQCKKYFDSKIEVYPVMKNEFITFDSNLTKL